MATGVDVRNVCDILEAQPPLIFLKAGHSLVDTGHKPPPLLFAPCVASVTRKAQVDLQGLVLQRACCHLLCRSLRTNNAVSGALLRPRGHFQPGPVRAPEVLEWLAVATGGALTYARARSKLRFN
eukprot:scaffold830_cov377-Prasinococcus_capsulatus_cf.AAC.21